VTVAIAPGTSGAPTPAATPAAASAAHGAVAAPAGRPALELRGVTKRFAVPRGWREMLRAPREARWKTALDALTLEVPEGACYGVLGPNGAGKTTLFRVLSGTVLPDAGAVRVAGIDALADPARVRTRLAPASNDERTLLWRLDARGNLELYAALRGLAGAAARARVDEALEVVGLGDAGRARVATFSSGMRQRLLVARALLAHPRILLLDEPTRSLDPLAARSLRAFVRTELVARRGCTVVLATHDTEEALDVCDAVAVLDRGRVVASGPARTLAATYCAPAWTAWVADAPDSLPARLVAHGAARAAEWTGQADGGFRAMRLALDAGPEASARALARLQESGRVAKFEAEPATLATLIGRVLSGDGAQRDRARREDGGAS